MLSRRARHLSATDFRGREVDEGGDGCGGLSSTAPPRKPNALASILPARLVLPWTYMATTPLLPSGIAGDRGAGRHIQRRVLRHAHHLGMTGGGVVVLQATAAIWGDDASVVVDRGDASDLVKPALR